MRRNAVNPIGRLKRAPADVEQARVIMVKRADNGAVCPVDRENCGGPQMFLAIHWRLVYRNNDCTFGFPWSIVSFPQLRAIPLEQEGGPISLARRMARSSSLQQLVSLPAGAFLLLLASALIAPSSVEGSCSHLVTSRTDPGRLSSLIEPLVHDLTGETRGIPIPDPPRPCSGALCSGQPAAPAVPAGFSDGRIDSWAWHAPVPGLTLTGGSFLFAETNELQPIRQSLDVFHPPRVIPSA